MFYGEIYLYPAWLNWGRHTKFRVENSMHSRRFDVGEMIILKWSFMWTVTQDRDQ